MTFIEVLKSVLRDAGIDECIIEKQTARAIMRHSNGAAIANEDLTDDQAATLKKELAESFKMFSALPREKQAMLRDTMILANTIFGGSPTQN